MEQKIIAQLTKVLEAKRASIRPVNELYVTEFLGFDEEMIQWFGEFTAARGFTEDFKKKCKLSFYGCGAGRKICFDGPKLGIEPGSKRRKSNEATPIAIDLTVFLADVFQDYTEYLQGKGRELPLALAPSISAESFVEASSSSMSVVTTVATRSIATVTSLQQCAGISRKKDYFLGCDMDTVLHFFVWRQGSWFCITCPREVLADDAWTVVRCVGCYGVQKDKKRAIVKLQPLVTLPTEDPFYPSLGTFITGLKTVAVDNVQRITMIMRLLELHKMYLPDGGFVRRDDGSKIYGCVGLLDIVTGLTTVPPLSHPLCSTPETKVV